MLGVLLRAIYNHIKVIIQLLLRGGSTKRLGFRIQGLEFRVWGFRLGLLGFYMACLHDKPTYYPSPPPPPPCQTTPSLGNHKPCPTYSAPLHNPTYRNFGKQKNLPQPCSEINMKNLSMISSIYLTLFFYALPCG